MSQHRAFESEFRAIVAALPVRPGDCVLDLACGDGVYTRLLAEAGTDVLAIDLSGAFLEVAQREVRPEFSPDRVLFVQGDFRRLRVGDDRFDFVWWHRVCTVCLTLSTCCKRCGGRQSPVGSSP